MKIKRTVNGEEMVFELTDNELFNAFEEQEHIWDVNAIEGYVSLFIDEEYVDTWGITKAQYMELVDEMAYRMRRYILKYDMSEEYARDEAIADVIKENYGK